MKKIKKNIESHLKRNISTDLLHANLNWEEEIKSHSHDIYSPLHSPIQPSLTFNYRKAEHLIEAFQNKRNSYTYARQSSPTIAALENQINKIEDGKSTLAFSSGMAAITHTFLALLKKGDHIITSQYLFGNTLSFFKTLERLGIEISYLDISQAKNVEKTIKKNTKFFFAESISNPTTVIPDFANIAKILPKNIFSIIDNTLTPLYFQPKKLGFSFSMHSVSKYMSGNGSALSGSISDLGNFPLGDGHIISQYRKISPKNCLMLQLRKKGLRDLGGTLSPFNAYLASLGLETLPLRLEKHADNSQAIAEYLNNHPKVEKVYYPGLGHHPQHQLAKELYGFSGSLLSFTVKSKSNSVQKAVQTLNGFKTIVRSTHLGDARSMALPVAPTIFHELGVDGRKKIGIDEGLIRLSVGLENKQDIISDLDQALKKV